MGPSLLWRNNQHRANRQRPSLPCLYNRASHESHVMWTWLVQSQVCSQGPEIAGSQKAGAWRKIWQRSREGSSSTQNERKTERDKSCQWALVKTQRSGSLLLWHGLLLQRLSGQTVTRGYKWQTCSVPHLNKRSHKPYLHTPLVICRQSLRSLRDQAFYLERLNVSLKDSWITYFLY